MTRPQFTVALRAPRFVYTTCAAAVLLLAFTGTTHAGYFPAAGGGGNVGVPDLLALLSCWGPLATGCEVADLTNSGSVGVPDLLQLLSNGGPWPQ